MQLTTGSENILYHFIQLDSTEGILLCPAEPKNTSHTYEAILNNFRQCCQKIHALFQSTLRFKVIRVINDIKSFNITSFVYYVLENAGSRHIKICYQ